MPKAVCELQADLTFPLATHPREHNATLRLTRKILCGVTDDAIYLLKKIFPSSKKWVSMASHHPMHVSGRR
jgi:hypothetical protein